MDTPYCKSNPTLDKILREIGALHDSKNKDYTCDNAAAGPYDNFFISAALGGTTVRQAIEALINTKIARRFAIANSANPPNNETQGDTNRDLVVYLLIELAMEEDYGDAIDQVPELHGVTFKVLDVPADGQLHPAPWAVSLPTDCGAYRTYPPPPSTDAPCHTGKDDDES